jgi:hypothetical protein
MRRADLDMIAEIADSVGELGCELGMIAAGKIFGAEIAIVRAVAQHVIDDGQDRSSNGDKCFLRPPASFEAQKLRL